jgi:hypothetical protein
MRFLNIELVYIVLASLCFTCYECVATHCKLIVVALIKIC